MKKIVLMLLFMIAPLCYSQNLTFDELLALRKKNFANVEEFLVSRDWSFTGGEKATSDELGMMNFAYKKSLYNDRAESFLHYYIDLYGTGCMVNIQLLDKTKYIQYLNRIKALGCKLVDSKFENSAIEKTYRGSTTTIIVSVRNTVKDNSYSIKPAYYFTILSNSNYKTNYITIPPKKNKSITNVSTVDTSAVYYGD